MVLAKEAMQKAIKVHPEDTIDKLKGLFKKYKETNAFVVVDKNQKFVGEVYELDVLAPFVPEEMLDEEDVIGALGFGYRKKFLAKKVKGIMKRHNFTTTPEEDLRNVAYLMYKEEIRVVPVLDKTKKVLGVIHVGDIIRSL